MNFRIVLSGCKGYEAICEVVAKLRQLAEAYPEIPEIRWCLERMDYAGEHLRFDVRHQEDSPCSAGSPLISLPRNPPCVD